jgi:hypothetical protein
MIAGEKKSTPAEIMKLLSTGSPRGLVFLNPNFALEV